MGAPFNDERRGQALWDMSVLLADTARALHMRRMLKTAHAHGFAMLDALGLSPLALDILDDVIGAFDLLDGDSDFEDGDPLEGTALETHGCGLVRCGADDEEEDTLAEDDELGDEHAVEPPVWFFGPKGTEVVHG